MLYSIGIILHRLSVRIGSDTTLLGTLGMNSAAVLKSSRCLVPDETVDGACSNCLKL